MMNRNCSKKAFSHKLILLLVVALLAIPAGPASADSGIKVFVDGQEINYGDSSPIIIDGHLMVGVRSLALALGVPEDGIIWVDTSQCIILMTPQPQKIAGFAVGDPTYCIDNETWYQMDTAPTIVNGHVYMPARYVAEAFGYGVTWDGPNQRVLINKGSGTNAPVTVQDAQDAEKDLIDQFDELYISQVHNNVNSDQLYDTEEHRWEILVDFDKVTVATAKGPCEYTLNMTLFKQGGKTILGTYSGTLFLKSVNYYEDSEWKGTDSQALLDSEWSQNVTPYSTQSAYKFARTLFDPSDKTDNPPCYAYSVTLPSVITTGLQETDFVNKHDGRRWKNKMEINPNMQTFITISENGSITAEVNINDSIVKFNGKIGSVTY